VTAVNTTVRPVHFEDFSGGEFERLVFAYHVRAGWSELSWYGQTGSDLGRDIIGVEPFDDGRRRRTVIQCVNRAALTFDKAKRDMTRASKAPTGIPEAFKFVCRSRVSSGMRDKIRDAGAALKIHNVVIWSGVEFEEHLRHGAEFLLRRFIEGVPFPDTPDELKAFADDFPALSDEEMLAIMAAVFDRPAFRTPFHCETSIPAFLKAIEDTIGALNTGVWRTRDGVEIRRNPSIQHIRSPKTRALLKKVVQQLDGIRRRFKAGLQDGSIRHCPCGMQDCCMFQLFGTIAHDLDHGRSTALKLFQQAYPKFDVRLD
jgi:hypothetical protein